jgi:hypothetical protein
MCKSLTPQNFVVNKVGMPTPGAPACHAVVLLSVKAGPHVCRLWNKNVGGSDAVWSIRVCAPEVYRKLYSRIPFGPLPLFGFASLHVHFRTSLYSTAFADNQGGLPGNSTAGLKPGHCSAHTEHLTCCSLLSRPSAGVYLHKTLKPRVTRVNRH